MEGGSQYARLLVVELVEHAVQDVEVLCQKQKK